MRETRHQSASSVMAAICGEKNDKGHEYKRDLTNAFNNVLYEWIEAAKAAEDSRPERDNSCEDM